MSVVTYNMGDGSDIRKLHDLENLVEYCGASVIGMQEGADRADAIIWFLRKNPDWAVYQPRGIPGAASVPVLHNKRIWKRLRMRTIIAVAARFVGPGAGPEFAKAKDINIVVLQNRKTNEVKRFINTHFIASATRKPVFFWRRRNHFKQQAIVLARVIGKPGTRKNRRAVVMGDFNAERDFPQLEPVRRTGIGGWTPSDVKTHEDRTIDNVLGLPGKRRAIQTSSDHMAVAA